MLSTIMTEIDRIRETRLLQVGLNGNKLSLCSQAPPRNISGFYFLYTSYSLDEIQSCTPSPTTKAVEMNRLASLHAHYAHTCEVKVMDGNEEFWLVYNGIGGSSSPEYGLRERLLQEFRAVDETGSLAIRGSSLNDLSKWRYSFVTIKYDRQDSRSCDLPNNWYYLDYGKEIERVWRLKNGWPLLCRH